MQVEHKPIAMPSQQLAIWSAPEMFDNAELVALSGNCALHLALKSGKSVNQWRSVLQESPRVAQGARSR
jgi:hypothetical protein